MFRRRTLLIVAAIAGSLTASTIPAATAAITDLSSTVAGAQSDPGNRTITYVGTFTDKHDLERLGHGTAGFWFPQFGATEHVVGATQDNARDQLPAWVGAFNHTTGPQDPGCTEPGALERGCLPSYNFRTFSQDGPARSEGGRPDWAVLRLPSGECGRAGAIVDPKTFSSQQEYPDPTLLIFPPGIPQPTQNNTINRIQLQDGVPPSFFVGVVTDTTATDYDSSVVQIRGNVGLLDQREEVADSQIEPLGQPSPADLAVNRAPDVHVFRIDNFTSGDYLKLRLKGIDAAASFSGLLFDVALPHASGRHTDSTGGCHP